MGFTQRWADGYKLAWDADDPDAAAALYRPDCVFRSAPFREPEPPIEYTRRVFPEAKAEDLRFGGLYLLQLLQIDYANNCHLVSDIGE